MDRFADRTLTTHAQTRSRSHSNSNLSAASLVEYRQLTLKHALVLILTLKV
jgi:hypothetical protein